MTWGRKPPSLDWGMGTAMSPFPCSCSEGHVFCPEHPELTGSCKLTLATELSLLPSSWHYFLETRQTIRLQLSSCSQSKVGWKLQPFWSMSLAPLLLLLGTLRAAGPSSSEVRWMVWAGCGALAAWRSTLCLAHWTHWGWLQPLKGSSFFSSIKLYFFYQKFGLIYIYIYTNIYINISIYTVLLLH